jgi:hypothetical protein
MNILKAILTLLAILLASNASATQYKFIGTSNHLETKICVSAGNNDLKKLKGLIYVSHEGSRSIANTIVCNNLVMAHFAHKYGADETFEYLNQRTKGKNKIRENTVTIQDLARINDVNEEVITIYVTTRK